MHDAYDRTAQVSKVIPRSLPVDELRRGDALEQSFPSVGRVNEFAARRLASKPYWRGIVLGITVEMWSFETCDLGITHARPSSAGFCDLVPVGVDADAAVDDLLLILSPLIFASIPEAVGPRLLGNISMATAWS